MKEVSAYECEICGKILPFKEGMLQHEEMCRWQKEGHAIWIENGKVCHAEKVPESLFSKHDYGEHLGPCNFGCGCRMGGSSSSGPVDPFGPCPRNPH